MFMTLAENRNFLFLFCGFTIGTGTSWTVIIMEQQLITPCGYSDFFAGIAGARRAG